MDNPKNIGLSNANEDVFLSTFFTKKVVVFWFFFLDRKKNNNFDFIKRMAIMF